MLPIQMAMNILKASSVLVNRIIPAYVLNNTNVTILTERTTENAIGNKRISFFGIEKLNRSKYANTNEQKHINTSNKNINHRGVVLLLRNFIMLR